MQWCLCVCGREGREILSTDREKKRRQFPKFFLHIPQIFLSVLHAFLSYCHETRPSLPLSLFLWHTPRCNAHLTSSFFRLAVSVQLTQLALALAYSDNRCYFCTRQYMQTWLCTVQSPRNMFYHKNPMLKASWWCRNKKEGGRDSRRVSALTS